METNIGGRWGVVAGQPEQPGRFAVTLDAGRPGRFDACAVAGFGDGCRHEADGPMAVIADPAWIHNLRMYSFVPTASGTISDWIAHLDEVVELGFNAIHLLPITRLGASLSPYAAADPMTVDPRFADPDKPGTADEQFEVFVEEARRRGLRLCVDLVFNHVGADSVVTEAHPEWVVADHDEADGFKRAGWWCGEIWMKWGDLALLDFGHWHEPTRRALWEYMEDYARRWTRYAELTGGIIRLDNLHSTEPAFLTSVIKIIRAEFPSVAILGELFESQEFVMQSVRENGINLLLATPWEHHFTEGLRWYLGELHHRYPQLMHFVPMASHDSGSPAAMYGFSETTVPRFALSTFFGLGASGSVQGLEYGLPEGLQFIGFSELPDYSAFPDYREIVRFLNGIHAEHEILRRPGNLTFVDGGHDALIAGIRSCDEAGEELLGVVNMDIANRHELLTTPLTVGVWTDLLTGDDVNINGEPLQLAPFGFRILRRLRD